MSEQQNNDSQNKYGADWTPSPDDPNYAAYQKYQENLAATQNATQQPSDTHTAAQQPSESEPASTQGEAPNSAPQQDTVPGAWIPTSDAANPWRWDAQALPNQQIDGKPVCVPAGAWVGTGDPTNPWRWDAQILPNQYLEGKPCYIPQASNQPPSSGFAGAGTGAGQNPMMGTPQSMFGPDYSKESGEDRPDVPMSSRIIWFFVGMFAGLFGLIFAWMVTSRYPAKQRKQVTHTCWLGLAAWCIIMLIMLYGTSDGGFLTNLFGSGTTAATATNSSASTGAFN